MHYYNKQFNFIKFYFPFFTYYTHFLFYQIGSDDLTLQFYKKKIINRLEYLNNWSLKKINGKVYKRMLIDNKKINK